MSGLELGGLGVVVRCIAPITETQREKKMKNEMEGTGDMRIYIYMYIHGGFRVRG